LAVNHGIDSITKATAPGESETAIYRYKQVISPKLSLRDYNAQVGEALAGVKAMNKVIGLGMPIRKQAT